MEGRKWEIDGSNTDRVEYEPQVGLWQRGLRSESGGPARWGDRGGQ